MYVNNSSPDDNSHHHLQKKKRVGKACDSCRIKKTKCDGKKPCNKCIQDNKICVFTEKKKLRDKNYPSGYVELLETRLDLLTKSFEKMIQLSTPTVPFLRDVMMKENSGLTETDSNHLDQLEDVHIPINKVINHLINNQNLLNNLPIEWESGALIAANFNKDDIEADSQKFAAHKSYVQENDDEETGGVGSGGGGPGGARRSNGEEFSKVTIKKEPGELDNFDDFKDEFDDLNEQNLQMNYLPNIHEFPLQGYSTGGFVLANSAALNEGFSNDLSDFESDSNSIYSQSNPPTNHNQPVSPQVESFKTPSLFRHNSSGAKNESELFNNGNGSLGSLTNRLENHKLNSPVTISPTSTFESQLSKNHQNHQEEFGDDLISPSSQHPQLLRRTSSFAARSRSPSHQRLKSLGHIHKPVHNHHHGSHLISSPVLDNDAKEPQNEKFDSLGLDNDFSLPSNSAELNFEDNLYGI